MSANYSPLEKIAKIVVPQDKDQAKAVLEIVKIAGESGIKPTAINFPVSTLGNAATGASSRCRRDTGNHAWGSRPAISIAADTSQRHTRRLQPTNHHAVDATSAVPYAKFIEFLSGSSKTAEPPRSPASCCNHQPPTGTWYHSH